MKKLLSIILAGLMVLSITACGGKEKKETNDEPSNISEEVEEGVEKINMTYGDDETKITLYKPDDAFFSVDPEDAEDAGDIIIMLADDYSWDGEIMGYKHFEGISSNEPFVEYYFDGAASDDYTFYEQEATDLGIEYKGKPVTLIRYTYKEVDDEEEYKECFVGFEYKGTDDSGLMGIKITGFDEDLSESYIKGLFEETFGD